VPSSSRSRLPEDKGIRSFETSGTLHPTTQGHNPRGLNFQQPSINSLLKSAIDPLFVCCLVDSLITIPTELLGTAYFTYLLIVSYLGEDPVGLNFAT
jgi:hypothetical protein